MIGEAWLRTPVAPFVAACTVLAGLVVFAWLPGPARAPLVVSHPIHPVSTPGKSEQERDTDEWSDTILARPLFNVSRKPIRIASAEHDAAGPGMPRLAGIMISPYGKRAIFMPDGGKPLVLAEGATVDSAKILSIATDRVIVSGPAGDKVLLPTLDKQHPGLTPAVVPQPFNPGGNQAGIPTPGGFHPGFQPAPPNAGGDDTSDNDNPSPIVQPPLRPFFPPGTGPGMRGPMGPRGREQ